MLEAFNSDDKNFSWYWWWTTRI